MYYQTPEFDTYLDQIIAENDKIEYSTKYGLKNRNKKRTTIIIDFDTTIDDISSIDFLEKYKHNITHIAFVD